MLDTIPTYITRWTNVLLPVDGPIASADAIDCFNNTRAAFLIEEEAFSSYADYSTPSAECPNIDEARAKLCIEFANILSLSIFDFVDEAIEGNPNAQSYLATINDRYNHRNRWLARFAENIFAVVYFDVHQSRDTKRIQNLLLKLKEHTHIYGDGTNDVRYFRKKSSPLTSLLKVFGQKHYSYSSSRVSIGMESERIEKFLRELERQLDRTTPTSLIPRDALEEVAIPSGRSSLNKYNDRPISEVLSATPEEIVLFFKDPQTYIDKSLEQIKLGSVPIELVQIGGIISGILHPKILADIPKRLSNKGVKASKDQIKLLAEYGRQLFYNQFVITLSKLKEPSLSCEAIKRCMNKLNIEYTNAIRSDSFSKMRRQAIESRIRESAHSWDLVEITSNLFPKSDEERDYSRLMAVLWYELQEALYRPIEIALEPISLIKPSFRRKADGYKGIICSRSNRRLKCS